MFENYTPMIVISFCIGFIARLVMMKIDHRQYPSYPQGFLAHLTLGIIAVALGSVAIPALALKELSAVTFLTVAAQQFRDVRNMERQSLDNIEPTELVPRGVAYIEDIAKTFEARNYMVILSALATSIAMQVMYFTSFSFEIQALVGIITGLIIIFILHHLLKRQLVEDIAIINPAIISFNGPILQVNDIPIMNIGLSSSRERYLKDGLAIEIVPKSASGRETLGSIGQRQAIQHQAATQLGIRKDVDDPDFTPIARRDLNTGSIMMTIVPMQKDMELLIEVVEKTLVLETSKRKPKGMAIEEG